MAPPESGCYGRRCFRSAGCAKETKKITVRYLLQRRADYSTALSHHRNATRRASFAVAILHHGSGCKLGTGDKKSENCKFLPQGEAYWLRITSTMPGRRALRLPLSRFSAETLM